MTCECDTEEVKDRPRYSESIYEVLNVSSFLSPTAASLTFWECTEQPHIQTVRGHSWVST